MIFYRHCRALDTYRSSECCGGDLRQIHGSQSSVETGVDSNDETARNEHMIAVGSLGQAQQQSGDQDQDIVQQESTLASKFARDEAN